MIFGSIIGETISETGGARKIARGALRMAGGKRLPRAMGATGYIVSIPVFVDIAYIMMQSVTEALSGLAGDLGGLGFFFPFLLASVFTTATGSITVSMITTASLVGPLRDSLGLSPEMAAALIGSGAFCVFHVNSSFFWLLNRLHKIPPAVLLKTFTVQSLCMGISGLSAVGVLWLFGLR